MNAVEFVKDYGIDVAKRTLGNAVGLGCAEIELFGGKYIFRTDDLKQIVEAFELVESKGGLDKAKFTERLQRASGLTPHADRTLNAINLVEQCGV